ncbi:hypothetical protein EC9_50170 [Rosistilla ulvae]|uniref:Uncharacterized protein n=1 Tax=Rosistilla ulvae TaxID=1930277 RepID=A0A517M7D6_9BACT|nr:hypothetical protein [Rosistilla ulvae]QDS90800.1 hypothetical protein EC9_50170 [Rosistilla ulvae]
MSTDSRASIPRIVKDGVVVPQSRQPLAEGTHVEIMVEPESIPADLRAEMQAWDQASDEAWAMIEKREAEELKSSAMNSSGAARF